MQHTLGNLRIVPVLYSRFGCAKIIMRWAEHSQCTKKWCIAYFFWKIILKYHTQHLIYCINHKCDVQAWYVMHVYFCFYFGTLDNLLDLDFGRMIPKGLSTRQISAYWQLRHFRQEFVKYLPAMLCLPWK